MVVFSSGILVLSSIVGSLAFPAPVEDRSPNPDFVLGPGNALSRRQTTNYNQDYTTGGTVNYSPGTNKFSVTWSGASDFVVGEGWTTGTSTPITFGGSFSVSGGTGLLSVYGWSTSPLVEYYIIEASSSPPSFGTVKGSVTSDGSTYTIWENQRVNEPSIIGTATFNQYISVRSSQRTSGTVTLQNHFNAWAALGMNLGTMNYQVIAIEGWSGSGSGSQSVVKGAAVVTPTTTTAVGVATTTTVSTGGGCTALTPEWGQCGGYPGQFNGCTTCVSPFVCHYYSAYYSQCLTS